MTIKSFPLVISFYTYHSSYQLHAHELQQTCEKFNLSYWIQGINSWGSWELNCCFKPFFILQTLLEKKAPLLWVDADALFVRKPPCLSEFKKDFCIYIDPDLPSNHPSKVRSGTIYANYTQQSIEILEKWIGECSNQLRDPVRKVEVWDQEALRNILIAQSLNVGALPLDYIHILHHPNDVKVSLNPIIIHRQASRYSK